MNSPSPLESPLREALAPTYQLIRRLGQGGMGTVFLARDPALKRDVAVKVLSPELSQDPEAHARFEREAQAVAALAHPNVVAIFGVGQMKDLTPYFVMQYVSGRSLADRIEHDGPVPVAEARTILGEVAAALAAAHAKGIIHRDIKPANVLQDEVSGRVLVSDFGLAAVGRVAALDAATLPDPDSFAGSDMKLTQSGMRVGTPQYMSPEQLVAEEVTEKTDVYALGLLAYELLIGRGPFEASTPGELIAAHLRDTPRPIASLREDVDAELDALVSACLLKDAERRPTAADLEQRLSPRGRTLLEWPPPGLEWAQGALFRHARRAGLFSGLVAASYALLVLLGDGMTDVSGSAAGAVVVAALVVGALGLAVRARLLLQDGFRAAAAVRAGYTWRTLLEAGADAWGDTGALAAGLGHFAAIDAGQRSRMRRVRLQSGLIALAASFASPLVLLFLTAVAAHLELASVVVAVLTLTPLALQANAVVAPLLQQRLALGRRAPRVAAAPAVPADIEGVASAWYVAYDAVRGEGSLDRGARGRAGAGLWAGSLLLVAALACGIILGPLALVAARGPTFAANFVNGGVPAVADEGRTRALLEYAPAVDGSVTAAEAGAALYAMQTMLLPDEIIAGPDERARNEYRPLPRVDSGVFADISLPQFALPDPRLILARALQGFTVSERQWLQALAAHPAWREMDLVSRAAAIDEVGGRFVMPLPTSVQWMSLPAYNPSDTRALVIANASRAALRLADGDRVGAEAALRAGIGLGRSRVSSVSMIEVAAAGPLLALARDSWLEYLRITDDPRGQRLAAALDSATTLTQSLEASSQNQRAAPLGYREWRRRQLRTVYDTGASTASRLSLLAGVSLLQCASLRDVLFGASPDLRAAAIYARDSVARFPSERALVERTLDAPWAVIAQEQWTPNVSVPQVAGRMLEFSGRVLGNRRMQGCAHLLGD